VMQHSALVALVAFMPQCITAQQGPAPAPAPAPGIMAPMAAIKPWNYALHGTDWTQGMCKNRERQSPVSFDRFLYVEPSGFIDYHYATLSNVSLNMMAETGFIYIELHDHQAGGVMFANEWYDLVRIDIHGPSEHQIQGVRAPLELQLVHRRKTSPTRPLILSVLVRSEHEPPLVDLGIPAGPYKAPKPSQADWNRLFQPLLLSRPPDVDGSVAELVIPENVVFDINTLVVNPKLPETSDYFSYLGSLTAPPCFDGVQWFVRRTVMTASDGQVRVFADALRRITGNFGSFRDIMPWNSRLLGVVKMQKQANIHVPSVPEVPRLSWGPHPRTDGEYQAHMLAHEAQDTAQKVGRYAANLARHLREGYSAYARTLEEPFLRGAPTEPENITARSPSRIRKYLRDIRENATQTVAAIMRHEAAETHKEAWQEAVKATNMVA